MSFEERYSPISRIINKRRDTARLDKLSMPVADTADYGDRAMLQVAGKYCTVR